jgi:hypothetical protein
VLASQHKERFLSYSIARQSANGVPDPVARVAELMSTFEPTWALCGGWAVDAWLDRQTRDHQDLDITVFSDDQRDLFNHLAGWQLIAHDRVPGDADELWDGRPLNLDAHIHARSPEASGPLPERFDAAGARIVFPEDGFGLECQLNERSRGDWVLNREPRLTMPLRRAIRQSAWGVPTVAPEVIVFYKATAYAGTKHHLRPQDKSDFLALLPQISERKREWLRRMISRVYEGEHPWLPELAAGAPPPPG